MNTQLLLKRLTASAAFLLAVSASASQVKLHLEADAQSESLGEVSLADPALGALHPVLDSILARIGWHYADYTTRVTGYVEDAKIGKDLYPVDQALIYAAPNRTSRVMGMYRHGNDLQIEERGAWWRVSTVLTLPVYLLLPDSGTAPATLSHSAEPAPPSSAVLPGLFDEWDEPAAGPAVAATPVNEPGASASPTPGPALAPPASPAAPAAQKVVTLPRAEPPEGIHSSLRSRQFEGIFRQSRGFLGIRKPAHRFFLEDRNGKRIAWVDTEAVIIIGSFHDYLDKAVVVFGDMDAGASQRDRVIKARNMRQP